MGIILLCLPLAACKVVPQEVLLPKEVLVAMAEARAAGAKSAMLMPLLSLGGAAKYSRQTENEIITLEYDDQKSFRDGALMVGAGIYSVANAAATKASEQTAQVAAREGTKAKAAEEAAKLEALKESNRHAEALMEFEAAAPAVVPVP